MQPCKEQLCGFGKDLVLLCKKIDIGSKGWRDRYKGQRVIPFRIDQIVNTQSISQAGLYHQTGVVNEVIGGDRVRCGQRIGEKGCDLIAV